jgi:predicted dehydrogenase
VPAKSDGRWRVGIVGLGRAVNAAKASDQQKIWSHPGAIIDHAKLELVACFDPDERASNAFKKIWSAAVARDWQELIDHRLDCLLIAAPTIVHAQYLDDALTAQIPVVVCEKPLTDDLETARRVMASYRAERRRLHVYYPRRWISALEILRVRIAEGGLGQLRGFSAYYGNGLRNIGCHLIEMILRLLGPVAQVEARSSGHGDDAGADPTPHLWLRLKSGIEGFVYAYEYADYAMIELDLLFEKGRVRLSELGFRLEHWHVMPSNRYAGFRELALERVDDTDYAEAARRFWRYIREADERGISLVDDWEIRILEVVHAGLESLRLGGAVDVRSGD